MEIKRGIAVSPGVAIGPALVLDTEGFRIPQRTIAVEAHGDATGRWDPGRIAQVVSNLVGAFRDFQQKLLNTRIMLALRRALFNRLVHLPLPVPPPWRVGAAHQLVLGSPLLAFQMAHLRLQLPAPHRLRVVEPLVGEAVTALAPHPLVGPVRAGDVGAEQVHDVGRQVVLGPVVHQPL